MKKNHATASLPKPDKETPDLTHSKPDPRLSDLSANDSFLNLEVPLDPSSLPAKSTHSIKDTPASVNDSKTLFDPKPISDFSDTETNPQDLIKQIQDLQQNIKTMTMRVVKTEELMKNKDQEAQELKEMLLRLRETQVLIMESGEKQSVCKPCCII